MRLLPEARNSRFLALVLLLITAIVVYLLGVHWWFVAPHLAIAAQMDDLREQESRFSQTIAQRPQIERRLAEENRQYTRDYLRGSERERRRKHARLVIDRLEDWVGKLTQAQAERVREYAERAPLVDELRDRDRRRLQKDIIAILRAREARTRLPERVAHWEKGREPAYTAALEGWREQYFAMLMDVDRMLTPEQRARAIRSVRRYAADFQALAAR